MEPTKSNPVQAHEGWTPKNLKAHIQYAVDLEFWTIPFYMSAMYSIKDRTSDAFQLIQSVVNQEMLHLQSASNIANAYGFSPKFKKPVYSGDTIPHLDFNLDHPNPTKEPQFQPFSAEIGPLDLARINAMCLVEYPDWESPEKPVLQPDVSEYANIGEFYIALRNGARQLKSNIKGGVNQVDLFASFYRNMPAMTITENGEKGFYQVELLINLITDQGEGIGQAGQNIETVFQNTADDRHQELDHFDKFEKIKNNPLPETYPVKPESAYTDDDRRLLEILDQHFTGLRDNLKALFKGKNPENFVLNMVSVGAAIHNCWKHGVTPRFH